MTTTARPPVAKTWTVRIDLGEHDGHTRAIARLHTGDATSLVGTGLARLSPSDPDVPEIGDEVAVARALAQLSRVLLGVAADDLSEVLHDAVDLPG
ncbi:DUF1876 domain-containing protein [Nocardioides bigeumensis]|uniref:DUF1876 domain-containing protein n=1 Tax=Nocardioides bigeumensis TaxID=433657 RepID=A0ABN2Y3Z1_9ACTN